LCNWTVFTASSAMPGTSGVENACVRRAIPVGGNLYHGTGCAAGWEVVFVALSATAAGASAALTCFFENLLFAGDVARGFVGRICNPSWKLRTDCKSVLQFFAPNPPQAGFSTEHL
jgi:hypothetical protein